MSNISTVYDQMTSVLGTLFSSDSSYTRIPNADNLQDNIVQFLRKGYGLKYNGANTEESEFHQFAMNHSFSVVFSREIVKLDSQTTQLDTAVKELLEDAYTVQKDFLNIDQISIPDNVRLINVESSDPISDLIVGKKNFKTINVNFNFLVTEDL